MVGNDALEGGVGWPTWLRLAVGIVLPIAITAWRSSPGPRPGAAGVDRPLYVGLALIMAGSIAGASISYLTGVPV